MEPYDTTNQVLKLRFVKAEDSKLVWEWANDPAVRSVSFSSEPILWEGHAKWFLTKLSDPGCLFFIALNPHDIPIGQIRCEVDGDEAVISVSLAPGQRGRGYGSQIIQLASQRVFDSTTIQLIHAYIKPDNLSSIRAFTKAGFSPSGSVEIQGNLARDYILQRRSKYR
jgi:UDP-2,4-diacetamido-2,4,6-trideoxy-beta-L-altropyranose hydrolase